MIRIIIFNNPVIKKAIAGRAMKPTENTGFVNVKVGETLI